MTPSQTPLATRVLRQIIRGIDALLRRRFGIVEFDHGPDAVLRIGTSLAERELTLSDGTEIRRGDPVLELHFWNEHLLTLPPAGATLRWAVATRRQVALSLRHLAAHLKASAELREMRALRIRPAFAGRNVARTLGWIVAHHGFESTKAQPDRAAEHGCVHWFDSLWVWLLAWAFNPRSLEGRRFRRTRQEFWISRGRFIALYGEPRASSRELAIDRRSTVARPRAG